MKRAAIMFRQGREYREELFKAGLSRLGFSVSKQHSRRPSSKDVLVLWNRHRHYETVAQLYERNGATVFIVENGYIGRKYFAMSKSFHNGAGEWRVGGPERWESMNIELKPWRTKGDFVLVLPQRGIGTQGVAMPVYWKQSITAKLSKMTTRPVKMRTHPGNTNEEFEPYKALRGAWATVTWGSGAAIKALAAGIPVFYDLHKWIGGPAGRLLEQVNDLESPFLGDRLPMFQRLAWAQWRPEEIENGEAFAWLLG